MLASSICLYATLEALTQKPGVQLPGKAKPHSLPQPGLWGEGRKGDTAVAEGGASSEIPDPESSRRSPPPSSSPDSGEVVTGTASGSQSPTALCAGELSLLSNWGSVVSCETGRMVANGSVVRGQISNLRSRGEIQEDMVNECSDKTARSPLVRG